MLWLKIDKQSKTPRIRQIYSGIRKSILTGKLNSGTKLLSSRELAKQLGVSRNVVLEAYDLLHAEGYIESKKGSGTYVAQGAHYTQLTSIEKPSIHSVNMGYDSEEGVINFRAGTPDLSRFPHKKWLSNIRSTLTGPLHDVLAYGNPEGRMELREAICEYVVSQREVYCHPDQVIITAGTTQAIGIVCSLIFTPECNQLIVEDPITHDICEIASNNGADIHTVEVDDNGMCTEKLSTDLSPAAVYVTPSHQFPIGSTMSIQRRIELLNYAEAKNCYIIEDDYDSEFRFDGPPLSSLHGLSPSRVVYIGTFSKTLCPAIRTGYLILPSGLISRGRRMKWQSDLHNETISQLALARLIAEGDYLKHIVTMRKQYLLRREAIEKTLKKHFGDGVKILGSKSGLHLVAQFKDLVFNQNMLDEIEGRGAKFYGVWIHSRDTTSHWDKLLIGYGNLTVEEIERGIHILAHYLLNKDEIPS